MRLADAADRAHLQTVFRVWRQAERDLEGIGLTLGPATLEAAASAADFAHRTGEPWFVAAVTVGHTVHTQRLGALASGGQLEPTLRHEAFHLAQPPGLPLWLAEGLARTFSGEGARDRPGPTGLEGASEARIEAALRGREGQARLETAYREATRRAERLVAARGWRGALARAR